VTAPAAFAVRLLAARSVGKILGCGCVAAVGLVALPVVVLVAALNGLVFGLEGGAGADQVDSGGGGVVVGTGRPLPAGTFRVSQGFGCTNVWLEPLPPRGYVCPPDSAHPTYVHFHTGIDLAAATGVVVFAVTAGTAHIIESAVGFGLHIVLTPAQASTAPATYLYGHLSGVAIADGAAVGAGQPIGFVGSSGNSSGPHLHFEVDVGARPVNPCATFPPAYLMPPGVAAAGCLAWSS
jgi:murein DD-endopeptidase MepM/ murein hydrolase activator NlpD